MPRDAKIRALAAEILRHRVLLPKSYTEVEGGLSFFFFLFVYEIIKNISHSSVASEMFGIEIQFFLPSFTHLHGFLHVFCVGINLCVNFFHKVRVFFLR